MVAEVSVLVSLSVWSSQHSLLFGNIKDQTVRNIFTVQIYYFVD